jgi:hypothetical protein
MSNTAKAFENATITCLAGQRADEVAEKARKCREWADEVAASGLPGAANYAEAERFGADAYDRLAERLRREQAAFDRMMAD